MELKPRDFTLLVVENIWEWSLVAIPKWPLLSSLQLFFTFLWLLWLLWLLWSVEASRQQVPSGDFIHHLQAE